MDSINAYFYAHTLENEPEEDWQTLEDHLQGVARLASEFADQFNAADWGHLAGLCGVG